MLAFLVVWPGPTIAGSNPTDIEPRVGTATFTDLTGGGACSFPGEPPDNLHVGISSQEYGTADVCGAYVDVVGPRGSVRVQVTDHCRNCCAGLLDVTRKAFAQIADVDQGRVPVTYALARNPPMAAPISLRVRSGSSRWWFQVQVLDHGNALASVEMATGLPGRPAAWRPLTRSFDNFWTAANPGPGNGPFNLRITDIYGQSATVYDVALAADQIQHTVARLYQPSATPPRGAPASTSTTAEAPAVTSPRSSAPPSPSSTATGVATGDRDQPHPTGGTSSAGSDALVSVLVVLGALVLAIWLYLRYQPGRLRPGRRRRDVWW